ncbi:MAG: hypothetical protein HOV68_00765 [Streptomycetaceae bacterium]|nr:hypothetical protein [Streptomycetaceae bacterium]
MSTHDPTLASISVGPDVVADIVEALSPRLRKRLDAAVDKLAARPVTREGDTVRIAVDDEATLTLDAPGGVVRSTDAVVCGCLLAPSCVHRAAAVSALAIADDLDTAADPDAVTGPHVGTGPDVATSPDLTANPGATNPAHATNPAPATTPLIGQPHHPCGHPDASPEPPALNPRSGGSAQKSDKHTTAPDGPTPAQRTPTQRVPSPLTPTQRTAAHTLWTAAAAVLESGIPGAGAVLQAELLRAAHTAKLAGLHRSAAAAIAVTTGLRTARTEDPAHRLADLTEALRELLDTTHQLSRATEPPTGDLIGTARQPYAHKGGLRLYGLFSEPLRTASGHAGVVTYTVGSDGVIRTVSDVMPGTADRIAGAAGRAVRLGDPALDPHALSRAGLLVSGATESPTGRLGAGASVRAVGASGAAWHEEPLAALWTELPQDQITRVLRTRELPQEARRAGSELLFLDVEIIGMAATPLTAAGAARGDRVIAHCRNLRAPVQLLVADDHPALAYRDNLRLIAGRPGLRLRVIGRLEPGTEPTVRLLAAAAAAAAAAAPTSPATATPVLTPPAHLKSRVNLGLDRLQQADIRVDVPGDSPADNPTDAQADTPTHIPTPPTDPQHTPPDDHSGVRPSAPPSPPAALPVPDEAPGYLVHRQVERAVSGGRPALALAGSLARDTARLRRDGLGTGADLLEHLAAAASDRGRDVFGRLLPGDADRLARCWLATIAYARAVDAALTAHAWGPPGNV